MVKLVLKVIEKEVGVLMEVFIGLLNWGVDAKSVMLSLDGLR